MDPPNSDVVVNHAEGTKRRKICLVDISSNFLTIFIPNDHMALTGNAQWDQMETHEMPLSLKEMVNIKLQVCLELKEECIPDGFLQVDIKVKERRHLVHLQRMRSWEFCAKQNLGMSMEHSNISVGIKHLCCTVYVSMFTMYFFWKSQQFMWQSSFPQVQIIVEIIAVFSTKIKLHRKIVLLCVFKMWPNTESDIECFMSIYRCNTVTLMQSHSEFKQRNCYLYLYYSIGNIYSMYKHLKQNVKIVRIVTCKNYDSQMWIQ